MSNRIYIVVHCDPYGSQKHITGVFDDKNEAINAINNELKHLSCEHYYHLYELMKNKISKQVLLYSKRGVLKPENPWD